MTFSEEIVRNIEAILFGAFSAWLIIMTALIYASPFEIPRTFYAALTWSWPLLYLIGIACSIRAERQFQKKAFRLFTIYFILSLYTVTFAPHVNRWLQNRQASSPDPAAIEQHTQLQNEIAKVYAKHNQHQPFAARNVSIPLGQLLLVAGIWLISKPNNRTEQSGPAYPPQSVGSADP